MLASALKSGLLLLLCSILVACGGGSGGDTPEEQPVVDINQLDADTDQQPSSNPADNESATDSTDGTDLSEEVPSDATTDTDNMSQSDGSDEPDTIDQEELEQPAPVDEESSADGAGEESFIFDQANLLTMNCGVEVQDITAGSDISRPALLFAGQVGAGVLPASQNFVVGASDFWGFDVPEGVYVLVVEAQTEDNEYTNIGLNVNAEALTGVTSEILFNSVGEARRRLRHANLVTKFGDGPARLSIASEFGSLDYHVALYPLTDSIPIPFLTDCPSFRTIAIDSTESFELNMSDNASEWFIANLEPGMYEFTLNTSVVDGVVNNLSYSIFLTNVVNDIDSEIELARVNEIGTNITAVGTFEVTDEGVFNFSAQIKDLVTDPMYLMDITISRL